MATVAHWHDASRLRRDFGHIGGAWSDLGRAAGSVEIGARRIEIDPGRWSTPAHREGAEEEIFYVLAGSGLSWQNGHVYEVRAGDCLVHLAEAETHTLRAGPAGLDVLAFGQRAPATMTHLPRAEIAWLGRTWVDVGRGEHPFAQEAAAGEPEVGAPEERPSTIVALEAVEARPMGTGVARDLARAAGSRATGLRHVEVPPGGRGARPHCHSAEEELFVVLAGAGVCVLGTEEHPVSAGSLVSRPAGTAVPHSFRAGEEGLTYLAYGQRDSADVVYFPEERKIRFTGIGITLDVPG